MELTPSATVARPPEEVHAVRRRMDRLPTFLTHLDEVELAGLLRYAGPQVARWFGADPARELDRDLGEFRRLVESGAGPRTLGVPGPRRELPPRGYRRGADDAGERVRPAP